jgi:glutamine synthetase
MSAEERKDHQIDSLPGSLEEALVCMQENELPKAVLGDHIYGKYIEAKNKEWDEYRMRISQWELDSYLLKY